MISGSADTLHIRNQADNAYGDLKALGVQTSAVAVGSLPTCNSGAQGLRRGVTDALAPTYGATVANGGSVHTPVYCDGTNWIVG
jgi:hypothetical protein